MERSRVLDDAIPLISESAMAWSSDVGEVTVGTSVVWTDVHPLLNSTLLWIDAGIGSGMCLGDGHDEENSGNLNEHKQIIRLSALDKIRLNVGR
jgi:hypothetical protein